MILVTGSNGQLGSELKELLNESQAFFASRETCDISSPEQLEKIILEQKITTIINCAAYTAVDLAEKENDKALLINETGVMNLASAAKKHSLKLVHVSTDYVFDGTRSSPLNESDAVSAIGNYGRSKLAGEIAMMKIAPTGIVIRTSWLYSSYGNNFVKTILKYASIKESMNIVYDQVGTPTYARDLAKAIVEIIPQIDNNSCEIYHYSNEGAVSWYDFAQAICEIRKIPCKLFPIESFQYPTPVKRPAYSVLNKRKIKEKFNISIPYWKDSLKQCLEKQF